MERKVVITENGKRYTACFTSNGSGAFIYDIHQAEWIKDRMAILRKCGEQYLTVKNVALWSVDSWLYDISGNDDFKDVFFYGKSVRHHTFLGNILLFLVFPIAFFRDLLRKIW